MSEVRYTDVEVANPSTVAQRLAVAHRQADAEIGEDEQVVHLQVGGRGTQMGDDSRSWWAVTYEVSPKRV